MKCLPIPIQKWKFFQQGPYRVIIAETFCQKKQGLQQAAGLLRNSFLLFLDVSPGQVFHTKNCNFPIDIIALNRHNKILKHWTANPNLLNIGPMPLGTNKVLETNAGWCKTNSVTVGDIIPFLI